MNQNKKVKICPVCVLVSALWLAMTAGVAWDYLLLETYQVPIALLMGGTVVGIAYQGEKRFIWANNHSQGWKFTVIIIGMPVVFALVSNISKSVLIGDLVLMLIISYFLFRRPSLTVSGGGSKSNDDIRHIEKQMEQCC